MSAATGSPETGAHSVRQPAKHEAVVAGALTRWWEFGPRAPRATLLLVHGFRGDHHGLQKVVDLLPEYRILSPDLPGFGESAAFAGRHDIRTYADWLVEFAAVTAARHRPFVLVGHSFGTIVAAAAIDRGLSPDRLVLINPIAAPALKGPNAIGTLVTSAFYRLGAVLPERVGLAWLRARPIVDLTTALTAQTRDPALRRWIKEEHRRYFSAFATRDSVVEGFAASVSDHVAAHVAALTMPLLLIAARQDPITRLADVEALAAATSDSRLVVLDGVGHLIHYEKAAEAAEAIRGFLADSPTEGRGIP